MTTTTNQPPRAINKTPLEVGGWGITTALKVANKQNTPQKSIYPVRLRVPGEYVDVSSFDINAKSPAPQKKNSRFQNTPHA